jgi:hypothetical protein
MPRRRFLLCALGSVAFVACAGHPVTDPECGLRVIVAFSQDFQSAPDAAFVRDVARAARVELTYVRSITPALHVFTLAAANAGDPGCEQALARLRSEPRVRSVDIDARRRTQG